MGKFVNLSGRKFDRLTVLSIEEKKGNYYYYRCRCECGNEKVIRGVNLTAGVSKSCGCLQKEKAAKHLHSVTKKYNKFYIKDGVVHVILSNSGSEMLCDEDDWERLKYHCWGEDFYGYAVSRNREDGVLRFHDCIMNPKNGLVVDHVNRMPLDNRKDNLRVVTQRVNAINSNMKCTNTSGHTGVWRRKDTGRWSARIVVNYRQISLGCFDTKQEAIEARKKAFDKYFKPLLEC